jgi:ferredoxin-NADP reductase
MAYSYTITDIQALAGSVTLYTLRATSPDHTFSFEPGQYAAISFVHGKRPTAARCFSIVSPPTEQPTVQLAIKTRGRFTSSVAHHAAIGDKVMVRGAFGEFVYKPDRDRASVMLAGGIGIAPFMSMVSHAATQQLTNELVLFYSCHTQDDVAFVPQLTQLAAINPHFRVIFVISEGPTDKLTGQYVVEGKVDAEMVGRVIQDAFPLYSFFVCGPTSYMQSLQAGLVHKGARPEFVFSEAFTQSQTAHKHGLSWPQRVYALSAVSLLLAPPVVFARDNIMHKLSLSSDSSNQESNTARITAAPTGILTANATAITAGEKVELSWHVTGVAARCTASGGWQGNLPTHGNQVLSPTATTTYSLTCSNQAGMQTKSVTVTVRPVSPTVALATNTATITQGSPVTINWQVNGTDPQCVASGGWNGVKAPVGTTTDNPPATTTYSLTCSNQAGTQTKSVTVTVVKPSGNATTPVPASSVPIPVPAPAPTPIPTPSSPTVVAPTLTFAASSTTVTQGATTRLTWNAVGSVPTCVGSGGWNRPLGASGDAIVGPIFATTTYTITCSNPAGSVTKSVTITVNPISTGS